MKGASHEPVKSGSAVPPIGARTLLVSAGVRRRFSAREAIFALRQHRSRARVPCLFRREGGGTFCVVSADDFSKTIVFLPRERARYLRDMDIRQPAFPESGYRMQTLSASVDLD
ncbi:MAG TPA: hypothetical protein VG796_07980 [Verrucomicrobiales bacterium]|nr:hypothetical protein [Verrucomicrobiales bacterium]